MKSRNISKLWSRRSTGSVVVLGSTVILSYNLISK
ncbi:hypothetical protein glysoja_023249 [Glycine soja]|nr:hypothetical protein glysoja_023249 [Glycine soja]